MTPIRFQAVILRKQLDLPCYIIVKPDLLGAVTGAFDAEVSLNGSTPFPRRIHPWGKGSDAYFFNVTKDQCRKAGVSAGDRCHVDITPL